MDDAFAHHVWATQQLIDACLALEPAQLETEVPGTYGSIIATMRHLVGSDSWYLADITGDTAYQIDDEQMDLRELRATMDADRASWSSLLARHPDPDAVVTEVDPDDGSELDATIGVRLAQALHHGTDHRSQICTALTSLDVTPPSIDVWDYSAQSDRVQERPPTGD
jgi:uncharacterized damage-inducible protein DinB